MDGKSNKENFVTVHSVVVKKKFLDNYVKLHLYSVFEINCYGAQFQIIFE
jgi:hypothetical protein